MMARLGLLSMTLFLVTCSGVACSSESSEGGATGGTGAGGASGASGGGGTAGSGGQGASGGSGGGQAGNAGTGGGQGGAPAICGKPKPGASNTGVPPGVTLKPSGSITIDKPGSVVEGLDITGEVMVLADNVTIRNCRITSGDYYPIRYFDNDNVGLLVEDTEIIGTSGDATAGISFANYTARRVNVHGTADGFKADANVLIESCWVHDLSNGPGEHNDAVQSTGGKGVTIRNSTLEGASNAAVQTGDLGGATEDLTIECSWLYGGGYTLNIRGQGATVPKNTRIVDNRFGDDSAYGPWVIDDPSPTVTGNVWDATGQPIPYP